MSEDPRIESLETLLNSDQVTPLTREVLNQRVVEFGKTAYKPLVFTAREFELLTFVAATIVEAFEWPSALAAALDQRLWKNEGKGWRYDELPPEREMYRQGLALVEAECPDFALLSPGARADVLRDLFQPSAESTAESRTGEGPAWRDLFWEELLVELVETHYSHPLVQLQIGALGMADGNG